MRITDTPPTSVVSPNNDVAAGEVNRVPQQAATISMIQQAKVQLATLESEGNTSTKAPLPAVSASGISFAQIGQLEANLDGLAFNVQDALIALHQMSVLLRETERNNWIATANDILAQGHQAAGELRQKAAMTMAAGAVKGAAGMASGAISIGFAASAAKDLNSSSAPDTTPDIQTKPGVENASQGLTSADLPQNASTTTPSTDSVSTNNPTVDSMEQTKIQQDLTRAKVEETKVDRVNQQVQAKLQLGQGVSTLVNSAGDLASSAFQAAATNIEAKAEVTRAEKDRRSVEASAQQDFANELRDTIQSITSTFQSIESARHRAMGAIYNA